MTPTDKEGQDRIEELLASRQEFLQVFKRGAEFTEQLLKENERLRYRNAELEARASTGTPGGDNALIKELLEKVSRVEAEKQELISRFTEVERENKNFAHRYVEIEAENNNLMNIYVASYQLHSTLDFQEVMQAITEVALNFIGAEVFAVGLIDDRDRAPRVVVAEGFRSPPDRLPIEGVIGQALDTGAPHFVTDIEDLKVDLPAPAICIPLRIKEQTIGVIAIYKFLQQKKRLASVDHELFTLLAGHAATAIFAAKLYTDSTRKLNTIQGFVDLVTSG